MAGSGTQVDRTSEQVTIPANETTISLFAELIMELAKVKANQPAGKKAG